MKTKTMYSVITYHSKQRIHDVETWGHESSYDGESLEEARKVYEEEAANLAHWWNVEWNTTATKKSLPDYCAELTRTEWRYDEEDGDWYPDEGTCEILEHAQYSGYDTEED